MISSSVFMCCSALNAAPQKSFSYYESNGLIDNNKVSFIENDVKKYGCNDEPPHFAFVFKSSGKDISCCIAVQPEGEEYDFHNMLCHNLEPSE